MTVISPDHFLFDSLPEDADTCPDCGGSVRFPCVCDYFADPDEEMYP